MKSDELAFLNLQLAGMLKSGIPLEGALRQLSRSMRGGRVQSELAKLEADLAQGLPLEQALNQRPLPEFYRRMVLAGAGSNDLPGVLIRLADHYQRISSISTRLKGLMIYPAIVVLGSLALSFFLALFLRTLSLDLPQMLGDAGADLGASDGVMVLIWMPVIVLGVATVALVVVWTVPPLRRWLRWHLPGFRDAGLAQLASTMRLMLQSGTHLADALSLLHLVETGTPAGADIARWQARLAEGHTRFPALAAGSHVVPPLFSWLVASADEDMAGGFQRASEIYEARASSRIEMLLYAALPVSVIFLGLMLISQAYPLIRLFVQFGSILDRLGQ
jgi:type II secretory pathway component PulF